MEAAPAKRVKKVKAPAPRVKKVKKVKAPAREQTDDSSRFTMLALDVATNGEWAELLIKGMLDNGMRSGLFNLFGLGLKLPVNSLQGLGLMLGACWVCPSMFLCCWGRGGLPPAPLLLGSCGCAPYAPLCPLCCWGLVGEPHLACCPIPPLPLGSGGVVPSCTLGAGAGLGLGG